MSEEKNDHRAGGLFAPVFLGLLLLHVGLLLGRRLLPFIDLPNHLSMATVFRYFGEEGNRFAEFFKLNLFPKPNVFHLFFCGLPIFPTVEWANRIFYALYVVLLASSIFLLIRKAGGERWFAVLSFLLLYNFNVGWGLVEYTIAIPLVVLLVCFLFDLLDGGGPGSRIAVAAMLILIFLSHALASCFSLLLFFTAVLMRHGLSPKKLLRDFSLALPTLGLFAWWWIANAAPGETGTLEFLAGYYRREYLPTLGSRLGDWLVADNYFLYKGLRGRLAALLFSMAILLPPLRRLLRGGRGVLERFKDPRLIPLTAFFLCSLGCYLFLPDRIPAQRILYQRFSVFCLLSTIPVAAVIHRDGVGKILAVTICAAAFCHFALWAHYFRDFDKENRQFTEAVMPEENRMGALIFDLFFRGKPLYIHFPNYYIVWKKGIAVTTLADFRFGTVKRAVDFRKLPPYTNVHWTGSLEKGYLYDGRFDELEYILVKGEIPPRHDWGLRHFKKDRSVPGWTLLKNTRP